jgi:hypothetical protein
MISQDKIPYYLIAGFALASVIAGYIEFFLSNKSGAKEPEADLFHDEGTHQAAMLKNKY